MRPFYQGSNNAVLKVHLHQKLQIEAPYDRRTLSISTAPAFDQQLHCQDGARVTNVLIRTTAVTVANQYCKVRSILRPVLSHPVTR